MRRDLELISEWIAPHASVLDLGCGDGTLLEYLQNHRQVRGIGLEIDVGNIALCVERGIDVVHFDLDSTSLREYFCEQDFDYVVMTHAIQVIRRPDELLLDMLSIGREAIVTFPNFAYWRNRLQLAVFGQMPVTRSLPAQWYDTENIHLCTFRDFERLCRERSITRLQHSSLDMCHHSSFLARFHPNYFGEIGLYRLTKSRRSDTPGDSDQQSGE